MYADAALREIRPALQARQGTRCPEVSKSAVRALYRSRPDLRAACQRVAIYNKWMPPQSALEKKLYPMRGANDVNTE